MAAPVAPAPIRLLTWIWEQTQASCRDAYRSALLALAEADSYLGVRTWLDRADAEEEIASQSIVPMRTVLWRATVTNLQPL